MRAEYRRIYSEIYGGNGGRISSSASEADTLDAAADFIIRNHLETTGNRLLRSKKAKLREDARLLVYILFKDMILRPVLSAKAMTITEALDAINADLELVLSAARKDRVNEISAHAIIVSIQSNWEKLRFKTAGIWH